MVATAILLESSLSFLGLGDPNLMSWGYMVGAGRTVMRQAWWITVFPGFAILLTVLALNLIGEGLNDALNPRLASGSVEMAEPVVSIRDLTLALPLGGDRVHAVDGVSLRSDARRASSASSANPARASRCAPTR